MITADDFIVPAQTIGYDFYTGVPCSFLTPFINRSITSEKTDYVGAASEGEAVAIASGAWLAGRKTIVMCQNSGLGNCINPLTSLNYPFRIPTLLITTWRGQPGIKDEPQHQLMSQITQSLLETVRVRCLTFPRFPEEVAPVLEAAEMEMDANSLPFGLVMEKGTVRNEPLGEQRQKARPEGKYSDLSSENSKLPSRYALLEALLDTTSEETAIIATTGKCGRELFSLSDREQHLYQVGSMGCASGMGLGVSLNTNKLVVVLDGDGAALMNMGNLATIGSCAPRNLAHIVLDNGVHDSTGGQATVSSNVNFAQVALACGYSEGIYCNTTKGFIEALSHVSRRNGPILIQAKIKPGSINNLGRPTILPQDVARRFQSFLAKN